MYQQGVGNMGLNRSIHMQADLIPHTNSDSCCAICQRTAKDYYQHWACSKFFAICQSCYSNLQMIQCTNCKGVGTSADIVVNQKISHSVRFCPACQEQLLGTVRQKAFAAM